MVRKKKPERVVGVEKKKTLVENLVSLSEEAKAEKDSDEAGRKERGIRKVIEDGKSFLGLSDMDSERLEVYKSDGGLFLRFDDLDFRPIDERSAFLVWECQRCEVKTTSMSAAYSWVELGNMIGMARMGKFTPAETHQCQNV